MAKQTLTLRLRIDGIDETLKAFRDLPKDTNSALRDRTLRLSQTLAESARRAGQSDSPQSALVATTVKARRDRVPNVVVGGVKRVGRNKVPTFKVLFGNEFGAGPRLRQFRPHLGRRGYWFFRTVEREQTEIGKAWNAVADDIVRSASERGA